jgi:hypothetical protein
VLLVGGKRKSRAAAACMRRDENEREWAGNYHSRFRYHIFLPKTGAGAGRR